MLPNIHPWWCWSNDHQQHFRQSLSPSPFTPPTLVSSMIKFMTRWHEMIKFPTPPALPWQQQRENGDRLPVTTSSHWQLPTMTAAAAAKADDEAGKLLQTRGIVCHAIKPCHPLHPQTHHVGRSVAYVRSKQFMYEYVRRIFSPWQHQLHSSLCGWCENLSISLPCLSVCLGGCVAVSLRWGGEFSQDSGYERVVK